MLTNFTTTGTTSKCWSHNNEAAHGGVSPDSSTRLTISPPPLRCDTSLSASAPLPAVTPTATVRRFELPEPLKLGRGALTRLEFILLLPAAARLVCVRPATVLERVKERGRGNGVLVEAVVDCEERSASGRSQACVTLALLDPTQHNDVPLDVVAGVVQIAHERIHAAQTGVPAAMRGNSGPKSTFAVRARAPLPEAATIASGHLQTHCAGESVSWPSVTTIKRSLPPAGR